MIGRLRDLADRSVAFAVIVALILPVWLLVSAAAEHGFDPTTWIVAGEQYRPVDRVPEDAVRVPATGYDGQFYYALAQDPLVIEETTRAALDTPAYRAQRVLLPATAYVVSLGGRQEALNWAIPLLNLAGVALIAFAVGRLATDAGNPAWVGIGAGMLAGVVAGVLRDLTEPLSLAALALGLLARSRDRSALWGAAATAACLGRESLAVVVAALAIADLVKRRWRWAAAGGVALAIAGAWQLALWAHLGRAGVTGAGQGTWGAPLEAPLDLVRALRSSGELWTPLGVWTVVFMAATAAGAAWALVAAARRRTALVAPLVALAGVAVAYGSSLWADAWAFTRNLSALWLMMIAVAATAASGRLRTVLPAASIVLTLGFALVGGIPRTPW